MFKLTVKASSIEELAENLKAAGERLGAKPCACPPAFIENVTPETVSAPAEPEVETVAPEAAEVLKASPIADEETGEVVLDSAGLPWDARIHSSNKKTVKATGKWMRKRNITDALVAEVEEELRAVLGGAPIEEEGPGAPPAVEEGPGAPPAVDEPKEIEVDGVVVTNFEELMSFCKEQGVPSELLKYACTEQGLAAPALLVPNADKVPAVFETLKGLL